MTAHICAICGAPASFGFGFPGLRKDKPEGKRGYLWTCWDHRAEGEARRAKAVKP